MNVKVDTSFRISVSALSLGALSLALAAAAQAHHSPAKYDTSKSIQVIGTVSRYEWANPHVYIYLEQTDDAGKKATWEIEGGPPSIMRRMGWTTETLHVGDVLTVSGAGARNPDERSMIATSIKKANSTLFDFATLAKQFELAVHMNASTHDGAMASLLGHSIGKWEGGTLAIDTTHFAYHALGNGYGVPSTPMKHLIERLSMNPDGVSLTYSFEVTDPEFLLAPRKASVRWAFRPDEKFASEKCNLDNARRFIKH